MAILCATTYKANSGPLEDAQVLLNAGAPELALKFLPPSSSNEDPSRWIKEELLRWEAWSQLGNNSAILESRLQSTLLASLDDAQKAQAYRFLAHANTPNNPLAANEYFLLSQQHGLPLQRQKEARLRIIDNLQKANRYEDAYRSLLRYQQDFGQIPKAELNRALIFFMKSGQDKYVLSWLDQLPSDSPLKQLIDFRLGKISADQVMSQLPDSKQNPDEQLLFLMQEMALQLGHHTLQLWVLEKQVANTQLQDATILAEEYEKLAKESGNRENLVLGDDEAWSRYAVSIQTAKPVESRAIQFYLARNAQSDTVKEQSMLNFLNQASTNNIDKAALALIANKALSANASYEVFRYEAGLLAWRHKQYALCSTLWDDLNPIQETTSSWLDKNLDLQIKLVNVDKISGLARKTAANLNKESNEFVALSRTLIKAAFQQAKLGQPKQAEALLAVVQDKIAPSEGRSYWLARAKIAMLSNSPEMVSAAYLLAAQQVEVSDEQKSAYRQSAMEWAELSGNTVLQQRLASTFPSKSARKQDTTTPNIKPKNK